MVYFDYNEAGASSDFDAGARDGGFSVNHAQHRLERGARSALEGAREVAALLAAVDEVHGLLPAHRLGDLLRQLALDVAPTGVAAAVDVRVDAHQRVADGDLAAQRLLDDVDGRRHQVRVEGAADRQPLKTSQLKVGRVFLYKVQSLAHAHTQQQGLFIN